MVKTKYTVVPGFPGYRVSDDGRVQTCKKWRGKGYGRRPEVILSDEWRDLSFDVDDRGRKRVTLCLDGKPRRFKVSTIVLIAFVGPCPLGLECCHENGDESDDRLDNLRWDTRVANMADKHRHGTQPRGEQINTAKLTAAKVRRIRSQRLGGALLRELAAKNHITEANVSAICNRRTWKHV